MALPRLSDLWRNLCSRRTVILPNNVQVEWVEGNDELRPGQVVLAHDPAEGLCQELDDHEQFLQTFQARCNGCGFKKIKRPLLDLLYPHICRNPDCARKLHFNELLIAPANKELRQKFEADIFEYLTKHYNQFEFIICVRWAEVWGEFEFRQYLRKLWKNKNIEFYCCSCAKKAETGEIQDDGEILNKKDKIIIASTPQFNGRSIFQDMWDSLLHMNQALIENEMIPQYVPQFMELQEHLINDICQGTGLTRERLFENNEDLQRYEPVD